jgi:hypothetical protein
VSEPLARAAHLLALGLDRQTRPTADADYGELVDLFRDDPDFRNRVQQIADGLGLTVLDATPAAGLILGASEDSPLAVTEVDLRALLRFQGAEDRMIYGVAFAGIAAWCYPTSQDVADRIARPVSAMDTDRLIREHAKALTTGETVLEEDLSDAWQAYATRKRIEETKTGRLTRHCTIKMCDAALGALAHYGLMTPDQSVDPPRDDLGVWRPTEHFRAQVARTGGPLAWQALAHSPVPERVVPDSVEPAGTQEAP